MQSSPDVGDLDPTGLHSSEVTIPNDIRKYGGNVDVRRVALTKGQLLMKIKNRSTKEEDEVTTKGEMTAAEMGRKGGRSRSEKKLKAVEGNLKKAWAGRDKFWSRVRKTLKGQEGSR